MHPKTRITMPMDPDSPLNRAHQCERKAERMMNSGYHDTALQCYKNASDYIVKAMEKTKDPVALQSLRLQKENYDKMPNLVNKRKQLDKKKINVENLQLEVPKPLENGATGKANEQDKEKEDNIDGSEESESEICLRSIEPVLSRIPGVVQASGEDFQGQTDSYEQFSSVASEDTDSLLQCLNEYSEQKETRTYYRPKQVLQALRAIGVSSASPKQVGEEQAPKQPLHIWKKREIDDKVLLEELAIKNSEMRKHVVNLLEQMEHCQQENEYLKDKVETLQQELEKQKSQRGVEQSRPANFIDEFSVPFSLLAPSDNGVSSSNSAAGIVVPQTPPALAPLEMPNFDDQ